MTVLASDGDEKPVPGRAYDRLSKQEKDVVGKRVLVYTLKVTKGLGFSNEDKKKIADDGIMWMRSLKDCEYLDGINGIETLIRLSCKGAYFQYLRKRSEKPINDIVLDEERFIDVQDEIWSARVDPFGTDEYSQAPQPPDNRLRTWFHSEINALVGVHQTTRQDLIQLIDLLLENDGLYDVTETNEIRLKHGSVSWLAGQLNLDPNVVSKRVARLNALLTARTKPSNK